MERVLTLMLVLVVSISQPVVVVSDKMAEPVIDMESLGKHVEKYSEVISYMVTGYQGLPENYMQEIKQLLRDSGIDASDMSSFITHQHDFAARFPQLNHITFNDVKDLLQQAKELVLIFKHEPQERILHETHTANEDTKSNLFLNMDPTTLSGLLVALFLIIMLLIAVNCLFEIKTHEKFARNNLWVGKES